jgi:hypothetical protein
MADLLTKPRQLAPTVGRGRLESIRAESLIVWWRDRICYNAAGIVNLAG